MGPLASLLLVDDGSSAIGKLAPSLGDAGFDVDLAAGAEEALRLARRRPYATVLLGESAGADAAGLARELREAVPGASLVFLTESPTVDGAVAAMRRGGSDYLALTAAPEELARRVAEAARAGAGQSAAAGEDGRRGARRDGFEQLIGSSPKMQRVYDLIRTVAAASSTVLICGESGTGKERVAAAIHRRSGRCDGPFVRLNCSAFAEDALDSELFGQEAGPYRAGLRPRAGAFRRADGGTLFLDEVGDLHPATQVKLLRVIQEREVQPVGGDSTAAVDVRLVAATHRDLGEEVAAGRMREDLYFRLNVIPIHLPALRDRPDDIPQLATHFVELFSAASGKRVRGFTDRALGAMERYGWPGNVRELENCIERAVVLTSDEVVDLSDLPPEVRGSGKGLDGSFRVSSTRLAEVEETVIRRVLTGNGWNIKRSAEMLGITRATLYSKIRKYGLTVAR